MKKNFKRTMAAVMAAALTLSLAGTAAEADAAKKIKFASKSVTVNVKKTKTVKIKNVKAKKVKKLAVKSANKKIATVSKKGKTAVKVKGVKAGNTKVTATLTIKGQKKKTKLTLKVKVKKVTPAVTQAPATQAPATQAPTVTQAPTATQAPPAATQAPATDVPGPATDTPPTKVPPTKRPPWTPEPDKKVSNVSITYDYEFPGNRVVKFDGTVVGHSDESDAETYENAKAVGYPEGGIDVRYYDKVVVKYQGAADLIGDGSWFGKATLSSTDDGLGMNEYSDGLYLKYLNDIGRNSDGIYVVEYTIDQSGNGMVDGFDFEDVGLVDCISVQMANTEEDFAGFKLLSADFITNSPAATDAPATEEPSKTEEPTAPKVDLVLGKETLAEGETTTVEVKVPENVTIEKEELSVKDTSIADLKDRVVTAKKKGETTIEGTVTVKVSETEFKVDVKAALKVVGKDDLVVNITVETPDIEMMVGGTADVEAAVSVTRGGQKVEDAVVTAVWSLTGDAATVETDSAEQLKATVTGVDAGEAKLTLTVTATSGDKKETATKDIAITVTYKTLTAADLGGADALKYTYENVYGGSANLITYKFTADEIAKIKDGTYTSLDLTINVKGATDKSNCWLQAGMKGTGDNWGDKTDMFYGSGFKSESGSQTKTLSFTPYKDNNGNDVDPIGKCKANLECLFIQVEWDNPGDDKTIVFDGEIELTSITFKTEAGAETQATIPADSKNSVNAGLAQYAVIITVALPSDIDLRDYAAIQYEVTADGSAKALNAHLSGAGLSQYSDHTTKIENGKATLDLSKYANTITDGEYKVGVQTAEAGFKGNVTLDKIALIPKK